MKNLLLTFFIASIFGACSSGAKKDAEFKQELTPVNTTGFNMSDASTDVAKGVEEAEDEEPAEEIIVKKKKARKKVITVYEEPQYEVQQAPNPVIVNSPTQSTPQQTESGIPGAIDTGNEAGTGNTGAVETAQVEKKKGWSDAAKGVVIGGAAGAIGGAVINGKNRGKGAIIGAVIGAAGGYVIGRKRDKNKDDVNPYTMVVNK